MIVTGAVVRQVLYQHVCSVGETEWAMIDVTGDGVLSIDVVSLNRPIYVYVYPIAWLPY